MRINLAALALAASAAAMPMSAADTTSSQATTVTGTTIAPWKTFIFPPPMASLISSILHPPSETPKIDFSIAIPAAVPRATRGPGDDAIEPCIMPWGCRDNDKHDDPPGWGRPTKASKLSSSTRETRTVSVPTETSGVDPTTTIVPIETIIPIPIPTKPTETTSVEHVVSILPWPTQPHGPVIPTKA